MVHGLVWSAATTHQERNSFLCIGCLEIRLGRKLTYKDFPKLPVNKKTILDSPRLRDRKTRRVK
jgi:hypothetical protein